MNLDQYAFCLDCDQTWEGRDSDSEAAKHHSKAKHSTISGAVPEGAERVASTRAEVGRPLRLRPE